jgi:cation diffusion facilitator CzcD-associated flavoprotein CzcO
VIAAGKGPLTARRPPIRSDAPTEATRHVRVAIIGSGFSGLGTAIQLGRRGEHDYFIFERGTDLGGVWRDNTYPGCACDVESHLYSFSFAPNPKWTRAFSPAAEIQAYLRDCAERFGVLPHVRFEHDVLKATWDAAAKRYRLDTSRGVFTADVLVAAVGALSEPAFPSLPGLTTFAGTAFHSARWNHAHTLQGRRVGVVGTGASAAQFIPEIRRTVEHLTVFQRTPPWVVSRGDHAESPRRRALFERAPAVQHLVRAAIYARREAVAFTFFDTRAAKLTAILARRHLKRQVQDAALREKLTPRYAIGCKRILLSDDYYPALTQPNVSVITDSIREVIPTGIVTNDGVTHAVDTLIFGTGFQVQRFPFAERVVGRDGVRLHDVWAQSMTAHLGTTVSGFPNLFVLQGPNTGLGHTSVITMIESQIQHLVNALTYAKAHHVVAFEPRPYAQAAFVAAVDKKMQGTVWTSGGCKSWYLDERGRNSALWPGFTFTFKQRVERFDPTEYELIYA